MSIYAMICRDPQKNILAAVNDYLEMESDIFDSAEEARMRLIVPEQIEKTWFREIFCSDGTRKVVVDRQNPYLHP